MKESTFAPRNLDMGAYIESGEPLSGTLRTADLPRISAGLALDVDPATLAEISWSAQGRQVPQRTGGPLLMLDLTAHAELAFECQRCLHAVTLPVSFQCTIRFVKDEATAAQLDTDAQEDVLALDRHFDLIELIEDELIMAQPIIPRHEQCPTDVAALMNSEALDASPQADQDGQSDRENPFAVLAALKKGRV